jgi:flagellar biosynthetic protein FliP
MASPSFFKRAAVRFATLLGGGFLVFASFASPAGAQTATTTTAPTTVPASGSPTITVAPPATIATPDVGPPTSAGADTVGVTLDGPAGSSNSVLIVVAITLAAVVPGLLLLTTTFPRFLIVFGLMRQGLGLNTTPPNQVLTGLAAFLTLFVMGPTFTKINDVAVQPALKKEITQGEAIKRGYEPLRDFMLDHTRTQDLNLFLDIAKVDKPAETKNVPARVLIPAYLVSELRAAFLIGFLIWIPFLLIDLIVASVLSALGMLMMPPVVVSLPVKLALFVLVDGWALIIGSVVRSVH